MQYRTIPLLALLILFFSTGCAYYNSLYNAQKNFEKGQAAKLLPNASPGAGNTEFEKVIDGCALMIELYPKSKWVPEALLLMGKSYYESNQFPKAERKFIELENNYPQYENLAEAKLYKAKTWLALKRMKEGRALLGELTANPLPTISYTARLLLTDGLTADSLYSAALETITPLIASAPTPALRAEANAKRAFCLEKLRRYSEAIAALDEVLQEKWSRTKQYEFRMKRVDLLLRDGKPKVALTDLRKLYRDSDFRTQKNHTLVIMGVAALAAGDTVSAKKHWMELIRDDRIRTEETTDASYQMGLLLYSIAEEDSVVNFHLDRAKRDRPGGISAIAADSLSRRIRWLRDLSTREKTARERWVVMKDLVEGRPVPDSVRNRFMQNRGAVARDPLSVIAPEDRKIDTTAVPVDVSPKQIDTTKIDTTENSRNLDTLQTAKQDSSKPMAIRTDTLHTMSKPDSVKPVVKIADSLLTIAKLDTNRMVEAHSDSVQPDSARDKSKIALDTAKVKFDSLTMFAEWENVCNQLAAIYNDRKDDALRLGDTARALENYTAMLEAASKKNRDSYLIEYALLLKQSGNATTADSIFQTLVDTKSKVAIANLARSELSLPLLPVPKDSLLERLHEAERLIDAEHDTIRALQIYQSLAETDTNFVGSRAAAALAILQLGKVSTDSMRVLFTTMQKRFSSGSGATFAKNILSVLNDTLPKLDTTKTDSLLHNDSLQVIPDSLRQTDSLQLDTMHYIQELPESFDSSRIETTKPDSASVAPDTAAIKPLVLPTPQTPIKEETPAPSVPVDPPKKEEE